MTPEDVARVVDTAEMVHEDTVLVARFYELLFERHPELRTMFPADMTELHHRFVTEIEAFARAMPTLTEVESRATLLGARHAGYGVRVAHYPFVRDALLDALEEQLGARFTAGAPAVMDTRLQPARRDHDGEPPARAGRVVVAQRRRARRPSTNGSGPRVVAGDDGGSAACDRVGRWPGCSST